LTLQDRLLGQHSSSIFVVSMGHGWQRFSGAQISLLAGHPPQSIGTPQLLSTKPQKGAPCVGKQVTDRFSG
jgi:hypothetical protein